MLKNLLSIPSIYLFQQKLIYSKDWKKRYVAEFVKPKPNDTILDIGCGPGDILEYLPEVKYTGFDISSDYIRAAKKRFGHRGKFFSEKWSKEIIDPEESFDIIMANGVLHHLENDEIENLFDMSKNLLKPDGRLVTLDGCHVEGQPWLNRFLISQDRGRFVRTKKEYLVLAERWFPLVKSFLIRDATRVPYTLLIMDCHL